jgi:hypothetical protein
LKGNNNARNLKWGISLLPHSYHSQFLNNVGMPCALKIEESIPSFEGSAKLKLGRAGQRISIARVLGFWDKELL